MCLFNKDKKKLSESLSFELRLFGKFLPLNGMKLVDQRL